VFVIGLQLLLLSAVAAVQSAFRRQMLQSSDAEAVRTTPVTESGDAVCTIALVRAIAHMQQTGPDRTGPTSGCHVIELFIEIAVCRICCCFVCVDNYSESQKMSLI